MPHSYIAYKRADEVRVGKLVAALEEHGLDIWWDRELPNAESFRDSLTSRLDEAGCVLMVWTKESTEGDTRFVLDEARRGYERNILVAVMLDTVTIPLGFGEIQTIDLRHWKGKASDPFLVDLAEAMRAKLEGREAETPKGPAARLRRIAARSAAGSIGAVALAAMAFNAFGLASRACTIDALQPGLSDSCGAIGLGERPSRAERVAWDRLEAGSCEALQSYINRFPDSPKSEQAARLLLAKNVKTVEEWEEVKRPLALFVPAGGGGKSGAIERARGDAEKLCRTFGSGSLYRYKGAEPVAQTWNCAGNSCSFDGIAECNLELRSERAVETCGTR
ncbi:MAG: toll/interleukin-1 receptor domain-containing protein [Novosphingobium sp.]|nr:toll/interleukin-1 receptor domain-containing protein [Novosphingobium sp.]